MSILEILNELSNVSSRLEKEKILKREINNEVLKKVFHSCYSQEIVYWIVKRPELKSYAVVSTSLIDAINLMLVKISNRLLTGNAAAAFYENLYYCLSADDAEVLCRVVERDLKCGVNVATVNKIWDDLIPTYKLMLASNDTKKLQFPEVVCQTKFDGLRCLVTRTFDDDIIMRTRNGNAITTLSVMDPWFRWAIALGETWDGELVCCIANGKAQLSRKVSNGILNKAIRGTISEDEARLVNFFPWDIVDTTSTQAYRQRLGLIEKRLAAIPAGSAAKIHNIKTVKTPDMASVEACYAEAIARGEEGIIAKNLDAKWQGKRSFDLVKFKAEETADLVVVDWEEGQGKNVGRLGALVCETSDGSLRVNVGTGFSDVERNEFTAEKMLGKVIEVCYNAKINKKGGGLDSLYLPRFKQIRFDKSTANSSKELK